MADGDGDAELEVVAPVAPPTITPGAATALLRLLRRAQAHCRTGGTPAVTAHGNGDHEPEGKAA
jgi:hypothetical protein